ncbi:class I SAM-dependent methyltransferase [Candidatus Borrarchaeum sp.]|uniref:class I SAM-dependent methyltransferase n=1 Tax=Candidatus Borrarchaeum sp. TaxID=2846742 RepID=UPI0025806A48|nr:class I SAM-dependent methyltransferase [Candidatus Borrarchaeum sp.]
MERWEQEKGVRFLRKIGIRKGQTVLDFGSGVGHYSIPAAIIVGIRGRVYAIDKDHNDLNKLEQKAIFLNLVSIRPIGTSGELRLDLEDKSIDAALIYDVLHYLKKYERKILYTEVHRVLKSNALLSIYPKHTAEDFPMWEFRNMRLNAVIKEIQDSGFIFEKKYCNKIIHYDWLTQGCVFNFKKIN